MVTGSVAAVLYGEPRFTYDVDLVVQLPPPMIPRLIAAFPEAEYYVPPLETLAEEAGRPRQGQFNIIHHDTSLRADVYVLGDDPLHAWAFDRRKTVQVGGDVIALAPIEYVILRKLEWYRDGGSSKHLDDIRAMLRVSGDLVATAELDGWIARLRLEGEWERVALDLGRGQ